MQRLLRRAALPVDRRPGHVLGQTRHQPAGARDVAGERTDRVDRAKDHVLDRRGVDAAALNERLEREARQGRPGERAASPPFFFPTGVRTASTM